MTFGLYSKAKVYQTALNHVLVILIAIIVCLAVKSMLVMNYISTC